MKRILTSMILAGMLCACNSTPKSNEALVRLYFDRFNQHDWRAMAALYADTAVFKDPSLGLYAVRQSRQQVEEKYRALQKDIPDVQDQIVQVYPAGEGQIVVEFVSKGTAPNGNRFELPICTIFTLHKGKIVKDLTYYDHF